jgi:hypothetical protein
MISRDFISSEPRNVNILEKWPKPCTSGETQQFTGFVNDYRKFTDGYAKIAISLYDTIKENSCNNGRKR